MAKESSEKYHKNTISDEMPLYENQAGNNFHTFDKQSLESILKSKPLSSTAPESSVQAENWKIETYPTGENEKFYCITTPHYVKGVLACVQSNIKKLTERIDELRINIKKEAMPGAANLTMPETSSLFFCDKEKIISLIANSRESVQESNLGKFHVSLDMNYERKWSSDQTELSEIITRGNLLNEYGEKRRTYHIALYGALGILGSLGAGIANGVYQDKAITFAGTTLVGLLATSLITGAINQLLITKWDNCPVVSDYNSLLNKIKENNQTIAGLNKDMDEAANIDQSCVILNKINKTLKINKLCTSVIEQLLTNNSFSVSYSEGMLNDSDTPEKAKARLMQIFDRVIFKTDYSQENPDSSKQESVKITAKEPDSEIKSAQTAALVPVKILKKITIEQNWNKDEKYGQRIDGRYELREFIGEGGMGRVYKAVSLIDEKEYAVKFKIPGTELTRKHKNVIKSLKGVSHEHFISTVDFNFDADPEYTVMELIDGVDLGKIIEFAKTKNKKAKTQSYLSLENILSITKDVGTALIDLHSNKTSKKTIHNDIKPENTLIDESGKAYIGDCDAADIEADINSMLTELTVQHASGAGTMDRIAPERRKKNAKIDERSDIFSFGVMVYEMLTGELPMVPDGLNQRTDIPEEMVDFVCKCVQLDPCSRYSSMQEAMKDLEKIPVKAEPIKLTIQRKHKQKETPVVIEKKEEKPLVLLEPIEQENSKNEESNTERDVMLE